MIHTEWQEDVLLVTIDRPDRRNAVDHDALDGLVAAIAAASEGPARAVVLTGAGGHFCAGADLAGVEDAGFVARLNEVLAGLRALACPVIAAVDGAALGAGTQLAAACDLRVATEAATFGVPAAKLGLMVDHWTVHRLATMVGQPTARAMLLAAETISGTTAHRLGFVQRVGDLDEALDWAAQIARLAPLTVAGHKLGLNEAEVLDATTEAYRSAWERAWASADLQEGLAAFRERRPTRFVGE